MSGGFNMPRVDFFRFSAWYMAGQGRSDLRLSWVYGQQYATAPYYSLYVASMDLCQFAVSRKIVLVNSVTHLNHLKWIHTPHDVLWHDSGYLYSHVEKWFV